MGFFADQVAPVVFATEQGYVNNPRDPGGETNWGVTLKLARAHDYTGDMRLLTKAKAQEILEAEFFTKPGFDQLADLDPTIAIKLTDIGVNMGAQVAGRFLQRALTALNRGGRDYPDLKPDGNVGPVTRAALAAYFKARPGTGHMVLLAALRALQAVHYIEIVEARPASEDFLYGWLLRAQGV